MRITRILPVRAEGSDKVRYEECVIWVDELPPQYRRGKNKSAKRRQHKQRSYERQRRGD